MTTLNYHNIIWFLALNMSLCVIIHAGLIHRPNKYDEELSTMVESNGLLNNDDDENSNRDEKDRANIFPILYDDNTIQQMINHHKYSKRSKLNLHTNLNLPRYLRTID